MFLSATKSALEATSRPLYAAVCTFWMKRPLYGLGIVRWLGDLDSNQDWRSQSPLSYR